MKLGDWSSSGDEYYWISRSSDWMIDHFRAFRKATGDTTWDTVRTNHQNLIASQQAGYAPNTGLLADFVVTTNTTPKPAPGEVLEDANDGRFWWNACRDPWRIGNDAVTSGDAKSLAAARKLNTWIKTKTGGDPNKIAVGYSLNGTQISSGSERLLRPLRGGGDDRLRQPGLAGRPVEQDAQHPVHVRRLLLDQHPAPGHDHRDRQPLGPLM
ncbi:hypothetical protein ACFQX6_31915 [Streptosporangium lutulentum]